MTAKRDEEGAILYDEIGVEMTDPNTTLGQLNTQAVNRARAWAERHKMPWPPCENETDRRNRAAGYILF